MFNAKNLIAVMLLVLPFTAWAQDDDVYFVPKKKAKTVKTEQRTERPERYLPVEIIYEDNDEEDYDTLLTQGSNRDVDEYNRRTRNTQRQARMVQNPDGTFSFQVPATDTLYVMNDSTIITTDGFASELYARGYEDGMVDGEDFAYSQRIGRFGYGGVYASPWYYNYYDPYYYDDWYWGYRPYYGYYGYYGWHRPYWSVYWGWDPYWHGHYYGWGGGYRYHGSRPSRGGWTSRGNYYGGRGGTIRGGRASGYANGSRGGGYTNSSRGSIRDITS